MSSVIRAHDTVLGRDVAVKQLAPDLEQNVEALELMLKEARTLASFRHPNLVGIHDIL